MPAPKPHPCADCSESFPNNVGLRRHRYVRHTLPPPFKKDGGVYKAVRTKGRLRCPFDACPKCYLNRDDFQAHLRKVHHVEFEVAEGNSCADGAQVEALGLGVPSSSDREGANTTECAGLEAGCMRAGGVAHVDLDVASLEGLGEASAASRVVHGVVQSVQTIPVAPRQTQEACSFSRSQVGRSNLAGVELAPQVDYLIGGGILDRLGLWAHRQLLVLICRQCKVALTSAGVVGHLRAKHDRSTTKTERADLHEVCSQYKVYAKPEEVSAPKAGGPPVQGIAPPISGLTCAAAADCNYSVCNLQTMLKHGREKHGRGLVTNALHRPSTVQVLFQGIGHVYFEVDGSLTSSSDADARAYLKRNFLPKSSTDEVVTQQSDRDRTPLLKITQWDLFLPTIREDAAQRKQARAIKEKHTAHEHEGVFVTLEKVVRLHHGTAKAQLERNCHRFTLAKVLVNGANLSPHESTYFKMLPEENHTYGALFVQMVRAMIRKEKGHGLDLDFGFTDAQRSGLGVLIERLETNTKEDTEGTLLGAVAAYQAFCWSLVHTPMGRSQTDWGSPIQRFIWLTALRDDGSFIQASDLTPLLAKLKYYCRLTVLYEGICCSDTPPNEDALGRIGRLHDEVLKLGTTTTFNTVWELQQFASSLAYGQAKDPDVFVDPGYSWISIHGKVLHLGRLRRGMQDLLREVKDLFVALSGEAAWPAPHDAPIVENLSNARRGYCFLEEDPFRARKDDFFLSAVERHKLGALSAEGSWVWDELAIRSFMDRADAIWGLFIHVLYVGLQLSTRVTQLLQYQIRNADRLRNFMFQGNECMAINRYSKNANIKGRDGCVPAFLSAPLAEVFLVLLGSGLREAQALLGGVIYGSEARWHYRTYLCVEHGERIKPDRFYDLLPKRNQQWFSCGWGASEFRQGMVTLGHEFISPNETFPCVDDLLAESADHSTEVDASHYAVVHGSLPRISNGALSQRRWFCEEWSSLLGLGPYSPPEPVRVIRTRGRPTNSLDPNALALKVAEHAWDTFMNKLGAIGVAPDLITNLAHQRPMQAAPAPWQPGGDGSSPVDSDRHFLDLDPDVTPLDSPAPATTIRPQGSGISVSSADSNSSVHTFQVLPAPRTPQSSRAREMHLPGRNKRPVHEVACAQESMRPEKRIRPPTPRSASGGRQRSGPPGGNRDSCLFKGFMAPDAPDDEAPSQPCTKYDGDTAEDSTHYELQPTFVDSWDSMPAQDASRRGSQSEMLVTRNVPHIPLMEEAMLKDNIREAIRSLLGDPAAREKSTAQMMGILTVMRGGQDVVITMPTGGGKTMLWQVPLLLNNELRFIVVCPFTVLLEEQCKRAEGAKLKAINFGQSRVIPTEVQILFVQVEHVSSQSFREMLLHPETPKFTHIFVDEHHDQLDCPEDRRKAWKALAQWASMMDAPVVLLSGSVPPCLERPLLQTYGLSNTDSTAFIRSSTNRPEIGLHTIYLDPSASGSALAHLVHALHSRLNSDERMLILFPSCVEAEEFAAKAPCSVFHSRLPSSGNTKAYNLDLWDRGEVKAMACTSAFATGVDRPSIRFVVIYKPTYSLTMVAQMAGRAGRDASESHVFFATPKRSGPMFKQKEDHRLVYELGKLVHEKECKVFQMARYMDGERMARTCGDLQGQVPCDVCEPNSEIHQFAANAAATPGRTVPQLGDAGDVNKLSPTYAGRGLVERGFGRNAEKLKGKARAAGGHSERVSKCSSDYFGSDQPTDGPGQAAEFTGAASSLLPENANRCFYPFSQAAVAAPIGKTSPLSPGIQRNFSLPDVSGHSSRVKRVHTAKERRLASTKELDKYMPALKGKCPYHFVMEGRVIDDDFPHCPREPKGAGDYRGFKRSFVFEKFAYCYSCGLPQDRNRNGEGPICHMDHNFRGSGPCAFGQFIFRATFCLWQVPKLRAELIRDLHIQRPLRTQEEFTEWAVDELADQGQYHNCLEAFLWFCRRREQGPV